MQIIGDPVGTIPFWVMLGLIAIGALFLVATPYTVDWEESAYTPMSDIPPSGQVTGY